MDKSIELINTILEGLEQYKNNKPIKYEQIKTRLVKTLDIITNNPKDIYIPKDDIIYNLILDEFQEGTKNNQSFIENYKGISTDFLLSGFNKDYGKFMESIFFSEDYIIGLHATSNNTEEIQESILTKGLKNNYSPAVNTTIHIFDPNNKNPKSFINFLMYNHKPMINENCVIIAIPKQDINNGIWLQEGDSYYLDPNNIVGIIKDMHERMIPNKNPEIIYNEHSYFLLGSKTHNNNHIYNIQDKFLQEIQLKNNSKK